MTEKILENRKNGMKVMLLLIVLMLAALPCIIFGIAVAEYGSTALDVVMLVGGIATEVVCLICTGGLKVLKPQEAMVLTLFGKYMGTIKGEGFYFVNPLAAAVNPAAHTALNQSGDVKSGEVANSGEVGNRMSLKIMTLSNNKQKINDYLGNPVEIGIAVMWRVVDTAKAAFNVNNYKEFLSLQCDTALRNIVRLYPYDAAPNVDTTGDGSLRGSSEVVALRIKEEIQARVDQAGLEIVDARITYLAYAPEIAAAMLQRQQAAAVVDARKLIVDGAVGMVEMALERLKDNGVVELDEERKAAMVSNLLVVLCGNKEAQPIVNSGSLY